MSPRGRNDRAHRGGRELWISVRGRHGDADLLLQKRRVSWTEAAERCRCDAGVQFELFTTTEPIIITVIMMMLKVGVVVSIVSLVVGLMCSLSCRIKRNFWPQIPNPGESTIGNWSPDYPLKVRTSCSPTHRRTLSLKLTSSVLR